MTLRELKDLVDKTLQRYPNYESSQIKFCHWEDGRVLRYPLHNILPCQRGDDSWLELEGEDHT